MISECIDSPNFKNTINQIRNEMNIDNHQNFISHFQGETEKISSLVIEEEIEYEQIPKIQFVTEKSPLQIIHQQKKEFKLKGEEKVKRKKYQELSKVIY